MTSAPRAPTSIDRLDAKPDFVAFSPRLVGEWEPQTGAEKGPMRYERRLAGRQPVGAGARMAIRGESGTQVLPIRLVDAAIGGGVGLDAPIPLNTGQTVTVYRDNQGWPPQRGVVVRCEEQGRLYRLGLRMEGWRRA